MYNFRDKPHTIVVGKKTHPRCILEVFSRLCLGDKVKVFCPAKHMFEKEDYDFTMELMSIGNHRIKDELWIN